MRTDGQTDMTKLIVAFRNFGNAPKKDITTAFVQPNEWFAANSLFLNYEKTHDIHFMNKCRSFIDIVICYTNELITSTSTKVLGTVTENSLYWEAQTDHLIPKLCTDCY
jgi:hypothetical protein